MVCKIFFCSKFLDVSEKSCREEEEEEEGKRQFQGVMFYKQMQLTINSYLYNVLEFTTCVKQVTFTYYC